MRGHRNEARGVKEGSKDSVLAGLRKDGAPSNEVWAIPPVSVGDGTRRFEYLNL